jgi:hypothetical protein
MKNRISKICWELLGIAPRRLRILAHGHYREIAVNATIGRAAECFTAQQVALSR